MDNTPFEELVILLDLDKSGAAKFIHFPDLALDHVVNQIKQPHHVRQYVSFYFMMAKNFCDSNELSYDKNLYKAVQQKYGYQSQREYVSKKEHVRLDNRKKQPKIINNAPRMQQLKDTIINDGVFRLKNDPLYAQQFAQYALRNIPKEYLSEIIKLDPIYAKILPECVNHDTLNISI